MRGRVLVLAIALVTAACGSQVSRDEIRAAAGLSEAGTGDQALTLDGGDTAGEAGTAGSDAVAAQPGSVQQGSQRSGATTGAGQASTSGGARKADRSLIRIGHIGTYTGVLGAIFAGGREMAQVWAQSVNSRGGLDGHPVEIITGDDGGDPARNLSLVKDMVENRGVVAFIANIVPLSLNGSLSYLKEKGVPTFGGDGATTTWWEHDVLFPTNNYIDSGLLGGVAIAAQVNKPKIGLLFCGEASACTHVRDIYTDEAVKKQGGTLVYRAQISLAQPDFTSECIQARNAGAEALIFAADGNTVSRAARACFQQGYRPQIVSFGLALVNSIASDRNLDGMIGATTGFPWFLDAPELAEYNGAIQRFAPKLDRSGATATVWAGGKLLEVVGRKLSDKPTAQELLEAGWQIKNETLGGLAPALSYSRGGPSAKPNCYTRVALQGGKFVAPDGLKQKCISL